MSGSPDRSPSEFSPLRMARAPPEGPNASGLNRLVDGPGPPLRNHLNLRRVVGTWRGFGGCSGLGLARGTARARRPGVAPTSAERRGLGRTPEGAPGLDWLLGRPGLAPPELPQPPQDGGNLGETAPRRVLRATAGSWGGPGPPLRSYRRFRRTVGTPEGHSGRERRVRIVGVAACPAFRRRLGRPEPSLPDPGPEWPDPEGNVRIHTHICFLFTLSTLTCRGLVLS